MHDKVLEGFLRQQHEDGLALSRNSDLLDLLPGDGDPPRRYVARFSCTGLVLRNGAVEEASHFEVGIWFPDDYLRNIEPTRVVTWLTPPAVFHPNIRPPLICLGRLGVGASLVDILYQTFEVITYTKLTMDERDALNHDACVWARQHLDHFPVDRRPLKRRRIRLSVEAEPSSQRGRS